MKQYENVFCFFKILCKPNKILLETSDLEHYTPTLEWTTSGLSPAQHPISSFRRGTLSKWFKWGPSEQEHMTQALPFHWSHGIDYMFPLGLLRLGFLCPSCLSHQESYKAMITSQPPGYSYHVKSLRIFSCMNQSIPFWPKLVYVGSLKIRSPNMFAENYVA